MALFDGLDLNRTTDEQQVQTNMQVEAVAAELDARVASADAETCARAGAPGSHPEFDRLVRTVWRLRQQDGCPWDLAQTHRSLTRSLIEEAYEAVDAINANDVAHMREELGDVVEIVLLNTQIAEDSGEFTIADVCRELNEKLVRRHPHVFGDVRTASAEGALDVWDAAKRLERAAAGEQGTRPGLLDSVPTSLPALMQCQKISKRAAKAGFEWDTVEDVWRQVESERAEFACEERGSEAAALEFGDILFALVNVARREGIDAEAALAASNAKFRRRWASVERLARERGSEVDELTTAQQNELWDEVKRLERSGAFDDGDAPQEVSDGQTT